MEKHVDDEVLIQIIKTQHSILNLLNHTLNDTVTHQRSLPKQEQNSDLINLAEQTRRVIARKPKLKAAYKKLTDDPRFDFDGYLE